MGCVTPRLPYRAFASVALSSAFAATALLGLAGTGPAETSSDLSYESVAARPKRNTTTTAAAPSTTTTTAPSTTTTTAPSTTTTTTAPSQAPKYWGAWIGKQLTGSEAPWDATAITAFEGIAGKGLSTLNWSSPFYASYCAGGTYCTFDTTMFERVRQHGSIPFFSWANNPGTGAFTDAAIAAGSQDAYITRWAQSAKAWGHPFFLRFAWEMNGSWFPWGVGANGTTAADYVAMWRRVHDIFRTVGATNVTWVWCPNIDPGNRLTPLASLYPGDAYVDWTCLDGYNGNVPWTSFTNLFKPSYDLITGTIAPTKPMIIGETGSTESGGNKASWITNALTTELAAMPKIRGLLWFDKVETGPGGYTDWPVESTTASSAAFKAAVQSAPYRANQYASLATSPIPPPS